MRLTNNKILNSISEYFNSTDNVITNIYRVDSYHDYPLFYQYVTEYVPRKDWNEDDLLANGLSLDKEEALIKAVMETIERWYLSSYNQKKDLIFTSYRELKARKLEVLNPDTLSVFSTTQLNQTKFAKFRFTENSNFNWTKMKTYPAGGKTTYVPAQVVYFMHQNNDQEPTIRLSDSTGAAAAGSTEQAILNGIYELIERDAYAIYYFSKLAGRKVALNKIKNQKIRQLINILHNYFFDVFLFDITLDIKIPVFFCILVDKSNNGPKICVGAKCNLNWEYAIYGSIIEALQGLTATRDMMLIKQTMARNNFNKVGRAIRPILDRMLYWSNEHSIEDIQPFLRSTESIDLEQYKDIPQDLPVKKQLEITYQELEKVGISTVYWKQITPSRLNRYNLFGVKVMIPELQPVSLDSTYLYAGGTRLYTVPFKLGLVKNPIKEEDLSKIPHPLA